VLKFPRGSAIRRDRMDTVTMIRVGAGILAVLVLIPVARILHRTGHSRLWCLLAVVPLVNMIGIWILAYVRWPGVDKTSN
jgi:hypothetical protein